MKELSARENTELRVSDAFKLSDKRGSPVFTDFLNEQEQLFAERFLQGKKTQFSFWGGHESCARKMLCVSPGEIRESDFPIYPLTLTFRKADKLSHRDFLGSFLSLGIGCGQLGDIFTAEGCAVVFCTGTAQELIASLISKVGRVGVSVADGVLTDIPETAFEEVSAVVASMRADCIVSALSGLGREKSSEFIRSGKFLLNYEECQNVSRTLSAGDILTLRGYGKFIVTGDLADTKKGRLRLRLKKYS